MDDNWARERVSALLSASSRERLDLPAMDISIGGVRVTVSGHSAAIILMPGTTAALGDEQRE